VFYSEGYDFRANFTYDYSFSGMSNGHVVREKRSGTWALGGTAITIAPKDHELERFNLIRFEKAPTGRGCSPCSGTFIRPRPGTSPLRREVAVRRR
jgi:hypothetical protein